MPKGKMGMNKGDKNNLQLEKNSMWGNRKTTNPDSATETKIEIIFTQMPFPGSPPGGAKGGQEWTFV